MEFHRGVKVFVFFFFLKNELFTHSLKGQTCVRVYTHTRTPHINETLK